MCQDAPQSWPHTKTQVDGQTHQRQGSNIIFGLAVGRNGSHIGRTKTFGHHPNHKYRNTKPNQTMDVLQKKEKQTRGKQRPKHDLVVANAVAESASHNGTNYRANPKRSQDQGSMRFGKTQLQGEVNCQKGKNHRSSPVDKRNQAKHPDITAKASK